MYTSRLYGEEIWNEKTTLTLQYNGIASIDLKNKAELGFNRYKSK